MFVFPLRAGRKVAETMPMAWHSLPGQVVKSGLLGLHRQESMVDYCHHTKRCFQAVQYSVWKIWLLLR